jgi:hypothetical protein
MPAIGTLNFALNDGFDSGIAILLVKPPEEEINVANPDHQLMASPKTAYVICRFSGATSRADAYEKGILLVQKSLDILSITGRADLITRDAEDEHLLWWMAGARRTIMFKSTATVPAKMEPTTIVQYDPQGNVVPSVPAKPIHHLGFRFYRLSQTSEDLYDAFRNMYLSFENLLSSRYPKGKVNEKDWLKLSLNSASADLSLSSFAPPGTPDPISHIFDVIYGNARLPLFHAKDGKIYYAPGDDAGQRETVERAMGMLTKIVLRMAKRWFSTRRMGGSVSPEDTARAWQKVFAGSQLLFNDIPTRCSASTAVKDNTCVVSGDISVAKLPDGKTLRSVSVTKANEPLKGVPLPSALNLDGFDDLQVQLSLRFCNASAPKYMYPR